MKQSLIFTIIVSLLVFTIQKIRPRDPQSTTTYKEKCPCGKRRDAFGRCTINVPQNCPPNTRTTTIKEKCPCGKRRDVFGKCTIKIPQICPPNIRTTIVKEKCPCGKRRDAFGRCTIKVPIMCPQTGNN